MRLDSGEGYSCYSATVSAQNSQIAKIAVANGKMNRAQKVSRKQRLECGGWQQ